MWLKKWSDSSSSDQQPVCKIAQSVAPAAFFLPDVGAAKSTLPLASYLSLPTNLSNETIEAIEESTESPGYYLQYYALLGFAVMLANQLNQMIQLVGVVYASKRLHSDLLSRVLNAPMRFFEITPLGRILNRFSKDISSIDELVMYCLGAFILCFFRISTTIILLVYAAPVLLAFMMPIMLVYLAVAKKYLTVSRSVKRLEAVSRSPIYSHFSISINGASTIRSFGHEMRFLQEANDRLDVNHRAYLILWALNRWLCVRTDILSAFVVFVAGCVMIFSKISPSFGGLVLMYTLEFTENLLWAVRAQADLEMSMNSVERVFEYSTIEQEAPAVIEGKRPPEDWPANGLITISDLEVRYAPELPAVLKNVNFSTKRFEKIGVIGRTGFYVLMQERERAPCPSRCFESFPSPKVALKSTGLIYLKLDWQIFVVD